MYPTTHMHEWKSRGSLKAAFEPMTFRSEVPSPTTMPPSLPHSN